MERKMKKYLTDNLTQNKIRETITNQIIELLNRCNDISILDLIKKLLEKSI